MEPAANITITDNGVVTKAYEYKDFIINFDSIGADMCLAVDNGIDDQLFLYGNEIACQSDAYKWSNGVYLTEAITNPFTVSYQYTVESTYHMVVTGYNAFWTTTKNFHFAVSAIDCTAPNIDIKDRRRFFNYPQSIKRSKRNRIVGITDIACPDTLNNQKVWTAQLWDGINDEPLDKVSLTSLSSSIKSELSIPALFFPYGLYRLNYKVTMLSDVTGDGFFGEAETFVYVEATDLVVQIFEGGVTYVTRGPNVSLTIAPRDYSYDPDDPTSVSIPSILYNNMAVIC